MSTQIGVFEADVLAGLPALLVALMAILAMLGIVATSRTPDRELTSADNGPGRDLSPEPGPPRVAVGGGSVSCGVPSPHRARGCRSPIGSNALALSAPSRPRNLACGPTRT